MAWWRASTTTTFPIFIITTTTTTTTSSLQPEKSPLLWLTCCKHLFSLCSPRLDFGCCAFTWRDFPLEKLLPCVELFEQNKLVKHFLSKKQAGKTFGVDFLFCLTRIRVGSLVSNVFNHDSCFDLTSLWFNHFQGSNVGSLPLRFPWISCMGGGFNSQRQPSKGEKSCTLTDSYSDQWRNFSELVVWDWHPKKCAYWTGFWMTGFPLLNGPSKGSQRGES